MRRKGCFFFVVMLLTFCFVSCNDAELAKLVEGTWHTTLNMKEEDGTPYTVEQINKFTYVDSDIKDGGTFVERLVTTREENIEDVLINYTVVSTISGEWEVLAGDLHMVYNLSSLDVSVQGVDYGLSKNADFDTRLAYAGVEMLGLIDKDEIRKEVYKEAYKDHQDLYKQFNKDEEGGKGYINLKIEGDVMSYEDASGRVEMTRIGGKTLKQVIENEISSEGMPQSSKKKLSVSPRLSKGSLKQVEKMLEEDNTNLEEQIWKECLVAIVGDENYQFMNNQYMGGDVDIVRGSDKITYTFEGHTKESWDDGYTITYCNDKKAGISTLNISIIRNGKEKTYTYSE